MRKLGLKLWSCNTGNYFYEAEKLYAGGFYDYIELYVVPDTLPTINIWKRLKIPFILHNAHFMHGFNLAKRELRKPNYAIYLQTAKFADCLDARYIIFHGGVDGNPDETAFQLAHISDERAILENKPFIGLPNRMGGYYCRGATPDELKMIMDTTGCCLCLDFGHAICSAAWQGLEPYSFIGEFATLGASMFHLSDVIDMNSPYDAHPHLGIGRLDLERIIRDFIPENGVVSLETNKDSSENLDDFRNDSILFHKICGSIEVSI